MAGAVAEIKELITAFVDENNRIPSVSEVLAARGRGSNTTISQALKEWRKENGGKGIPVYLMEAVAELHHQSVEHVANQIKLAQDKAMSDVAAAESRLVEAGRAHREEQRASAKEIKQLKESLAETEKALRQSESRYNKEQTVTAALQARVDDRICMVDGLRSDLKRADEKLEAMTSKFVKIVSSPHQLGTPLYAAIRSGSDLVDQNLAAIDKSEYPFPVTIIDAGGQYQFQGGPGGQYRATDLDLYTRVSGGKLICLSADPQPWECPADLGGYSPDNPERFELFLHQGLR
tara:strand:- start:50844 stop:51716 length:873 start_codon:yes stop_codon:yes gene_type:complete